MADTNIIIAWCDGPRLEEGFVGIVEADDPEIFDKMTEWQFDFAVVQIFVFDNEQLVLIAA